MNYSPLEKVGMLLLTSIMFCITVTVEIISTIMLRDQSVRMEMGTQQLAACVLMLLAIFIAAALMVIINVRRYLGDAQDDMIDVDGDPRELTHEEKFDMEMNLRGDIYP